MNTTQTVRTFADLKPGDSVFVVHQLRRGKSERKTLAATVEKVGRKYIHIQDGWFCEKFCKLTGRSAHSDCRTRSNGYGFDVYLCEADYLQEQHQQNEAVRLKTRLITGSWKELRKFDPNVVDAIHKTLDDYGVE